MSETADEKPSYSESFCTAKRDRTMGCDLFNQHVARIKLMSVNCRQVPLRTATFPPGIRILQYC